MMRTQHHTHDMPCFSFEQQAVVSSQLTTCRLLKPDDVEGDVCRLPSHPRGVTVISKLFSDITMNYAKALAKRLSQGRIRVYEYD